uniref:AAA_11 domain-containing protein n=1 Tax=Strongyloides papillosus TaxID=174720 RepID=A0A0N5BNZ8_STREA
MGRKEITFEFERFPDYPGDEEELKNLLRGIHAVVCRLDPGRGIHFNSFSELCTFFKPLWETDLGMTLRSLLVDAYSHGNIFYKDCSHNTNNWISLALKLNKEQKNVLNMVEKGQPISFVQSPPGTGKTTTAISIAFNNPKYTYLIISESNRGTDAVNPREV